MRRAIVGLALVLSACGGVEGGTGPGVDTLAATVTAQTARKNTAHVVFDLDKGTTGEGVYRTSPGFAADFTVTMPDGPTRLIVLDKAIYLQRQAKPWVRYPAGSTELAESMTAQADIGRQLARIQAAGTIADTASEYLDGRRTTRYSIDVDVAKLADVERDSVVQSGLRELRKQGVTRIPYRLWLDEENLPVKIVMALPGQTSTVRYTKWGEPIEVVAPPV
jgi:hypothetical protein